jgi:Sortase domain
VTIARRPRAGAHRWRPRLAWLLLSVGLAMIGTGWSGLLSTVVTTPDRGTVPAVTVQGAPALPGKTRPAAQPSMQIPLWLRLPSLDVSAPVVPVTVDPSGALQVPDNPNVLGWWQGGALPGSGAGTVVIDGHVDSAQAGVGALFRLHSLRTGDRVQLGTAHGSREYVIRALRSFPKTALPAEVFATNGQPRLVLITCGGPFNQRTRQYADNIVAFAVPA